MYRRHLLIGLSSNLVMLTGCVGGTEESPAAGSSEADTSEEDDSSECADTVTIESLGMAPALSKGDEVCIVEYDSYEPIDDTEETGVIPADVGEESGYEKLGGTGDIIRYYPDGDDEGTPIIARAIEWEDGSYVTSGDNSEEPYPWDAPVESVIGVVEGIS